MKKITLAIAVAAIMMSCGGKKTENTSAENLPVQSTEALGQAFNDEHNAKNSLDYQGTYKGTLPTASGEGMEVTLVLKDSTYTRTNVYITPGDKFEEAGTYTWNDAGTTITLQDAEASNQYFVGENVLFTLDLEGKKIETELAEHYLLHKVN